MDYGSIGVNARFNFGRSSPVYALVRAGYWSAEEKSDYGMDVDGGYFGSAWASTSTATSTSA